MSDFRKRGRVVEGSSLENCRRCEPFVSSNLTASAKKDELAALERLFYFLVKASRASARS
jgi:hypothetical protein